MEGLFNKYPTFFYNGVDALDITRRVKISDLPRGATLFYPLVLTAGIRHDTLADAYYEDGTLDWLIFLANDIFETYYQWYLDENEFNDYISEKYGSFEFAVEKTKCWRHNWGSSEAEISVSYYENTLPLDWKQYYSPIYGPKEVVTSYRRKPEDWLIATNEILQYGIEYTSGNAFSNGEILDIEFETEPTGGAEVVVSNSSTLIVHHTQGNTAANTTHVLTLIGETSNTQATANLVTVLAEVVTNADSRFWSRVSYFDWENEKNEKRKHLQILDNRFSLEAAEQFRIKLQE